MSLFADWEDDTVMVQRIGDPDGFGGRAPFGAPYQLACQVEQTSVRLRTAAGQETLSTAALYASDLSSDARLIVPGDQVTLPDGRVTSVLTVTIVAEGTELDGVTVTVE